MTYATTCTTNGTDDSKYVLTEWFLNEPTGNSCTDTTWRSWNVTGTTSAVSEYTWSGWNVRYYEAAAAPVSEPAANRPAAPPPLTTEEIGAMRKRANDLLREHLSAEQQEQLAKVGWFHEVIEGVKYLFQPGASVAEWNTENKRVASYCIHPGGNYPAEDIALAQLLLLRHNPAEFKRIANRTAYS